MAQHDDDLSQLDADDALLSAVAAGRDEQGVTDDPAVALLVDIVRTVDGLSPSDSPGGSGRGGRRRRGGLWGISLGVSIVVAAGGGLSAAATDRLPEPMQRFAVEVGQAAPPAEAEQVVVTPTEAWPQSDADASGGVPYRDQQSGESPWQDPQNASWWEGAQAVPGAASRDRHSGADAFSYGAPSPSGDRSSMWGDTYGSWSGGYGTSSGWGGYSVDYPYSQTSPYTSPYSSSYPQPMGDSEPTPAGSASPQPPGYVAPTAPRETAEPTPSPAPSRGSVSRGGSSSPSPSSSSHGQASGSRNPSPSSHATSSTQPGKRTYGHETPRSSH